MTSCMAMDSHVAKTLGQEYVCVCVCVGGGGGGGGGSSMGALSAACFV